MRWDGHTYTQIGHALDRTACSVANWLQARGKGRTRAQDEREAMLRRALPMWVAETPIPAIMDAVGWPASRQAMWEGLRRYQRRLGSQHAGG